MISLKLIFYNRNINEKTEAPDTEAITAKYTHFQKENVCPYVSTFQNSLKPRWIAISNVIESFAFLNYLHRYTQLSSKTVTCSLIKLL